MSGIDSIFKINSKRIDWIDVCKGIGIILVIIGHSVVLGGDVRTFIFSFHMPMFFILSGYTYKPPKSFQELGTRTVKRFKRLIIPCFIVSAINVIGPWTLYSAHNLDVLRNSALTMLDALLWGSGVAVGNHNLIGILWFVISLFWADVLFDIFHLIFKEQFIIYVCTFTAWAGVFLGTHSILLPQNFDVTLVVVFFICIGALLSKYKEQIEKYKYLIFFACVLVWGLTLNFHICIELASRYYPYTVLSFLEAICGTLVYIFICRAFCCIKAIKNCFMFLGEHTLLILMIHHMDWLGSPLWQGKATWLICIYRVAYVLAVSMAIYIFKTFLLNFMQQKRCGSGQIQ